MNKPIKRFITLCSLAAAIGASIPANAQVNNDWYDIEVVVFTQGRQADIASESWPKSPEVRYPTNAIYVYSPEEIIRQTLVSTEVAPANPPELEQMSFSEQETNVLQTDDIGAAHETRLAIPYSVSQQARDVYHQYLNNLGINFALTAEEQSQIVVLDDLTSIYRDLADYTELSITDRAFDLNRLETAGHRVLVAKRWRQYIPANSNAQPVIFQGGQQFGDHYELEGTITFNRERLLHTDLNLWFSTFELNLDEESETRLPSAPARALEITSEQEPTFGFINLQANDEAGLPSHVSTQLFVMNQVRLMRSETLHYIDHPAFGVLIYVHRYPERDELVEQFFGTTEQ